MKKKVCLVSMGCSKNLVDSEVMLGLLEEKGYGYTANPQNSDIVIVNTCSFIEKSTDESVDKILELAELKQKNKIKILIVAGCLSQKYKKNELLDGFPEVDAFIGTSDFPKIVSIINKININKKIFIVDSNPGFLYNASQPRHILTPKHYLNIKIADGCRNRCSYCLIPKLRGDYRSRKIPSVVTEIKKLTGNNRIAELNLIAQDSTYYGTDVYGSRKLVELLKSIVKIKTCRWIRLMYTHPAHFDDELIEFISREPVLCKYIDLPLQHINNSILKRMGRKVSRKQIVELIDKLRRNIPGVAIRTSFITGFPGETEKQFQELLEFIKETRFDRLGVFTYSRQEGTRAYSFPRQVPEKVKNKRLRALMSAQKKISAEINKALIGSKIEVLVDGVSEDGGFLLCRSQRDAPEIDGYVLVKSGKGKPGDFLEVEVTGSDAYDLTAKTV